MPQGTSCAATLRGGPVPPVDADRGAEYYYLLDNQGGATNVTNSSGAVQTTYT
jgi:hypothetical protein